MHKLSGKVAIITASTEGIGFAIAKKLASEGAKIVISSRKETNVHNAVNNLQKQGFTDVIGTVCHVAKAEDRSNLFKKATEAFGRIDILVSNAAANPAFGSVEECTESVFDKIFEVNVKAPFCLTTEILPFFRKNNGGNIIYISSVAAFHPINLIGVYSVSKTALLGLTKLFASELASSNIRVNCVAPGLINTKFSKALLENDVAREVSLSQIPMNRAGEADDVGGIVAFLCSDEASYITGETIVVGGGMPSRL